MCLHRVNITLVLFSLSSYQSIIKETCPTAEGQVFIDWSLNMVTEFDDSKKFLSIVCLVRNLL